MQCPYCKQQHADNIKFCPVTGQALPQVQPRTICPSCNREIPSGIVFCPQCGHDLLHRRGLRPTALIVGTLIGVALIGLLSWLVWQAVKGSEEESVSIAMQEQPSQELESINLDTTETGMLDLDEGNAGLQVLVEASATATIPVTDTATFTPTIPLITDTPAPTTTPLPSATPSPSPTPMVVNPIDQAELIFIPGGEFIMGSDPVEDPYFYGSEGPPHTVTLSEYWIYRTEVTNTMYQQCTDVKACPRPAYARSNTRTEYYGNPIYADYPVVYVSWKNASSYCLWVGGRLPTEAEWEKAARGTDERLFPWGNQPPMPSYANYGAQDTKPVGSYPDGASPYGVMDMAGNVIEWVRDYFQATYYQVSPYENPLGPASGSTRVYRGGAYHNPASGIRVVMRGSRSESHSNVDIGFRCVVESIPQ
jgi:formylglycine-generating enzyme required for sulfatase activity/predicted nucleic acid-binding Zn ribbon protein